MKKVFLSVVFLLSVTFLFAQFPVKQTLGSSSTIVNSKGALSLDSGFVNSVFVDTAAATRGRIAAYPGAQIRVGNTIWLRDSTAVKWLRLGGSDSTITAGIISSLPVIGDNVGTNITAGKFIQTEFFKSQPPTAGLSGGSAIELHLAGTFSAALNWTAGRQAATATLSTINVAGINQSFSQPAQGASVSGTQNVTVPYNTDITYNNTVTTTDSKTATASTTFTFLPKRYWGVSNGTPVAADLIASTGGGQELSNSKSKGAFVVTVAGSTQNVFYAFPSGEGTLSSIIVTGLESIGAFTLTTATIINASGYSQTYLIYTSNNTFSATTVSFNSVN